MFQQKYQCIWREISCLFPTVKVWPLIVSSVLTTFSVCAFETEVSPRSLAVDNNNNRGEMKSDMQAGFSPTAELAGGNLFVRGSGSDDLSISRSGAVVLIRDKEKTLIAGVGVTQVNSQTLSVPFANITGAVIVDTATGDDLLTLDYTSGNPVPVAGLDYHGGTGNDTLAVVAEHLDTVYTPSRDVFGDGSLRMAGSQVRFTGLEPVDYDVVSGTFTLTLPGADDVITIGDDFLVDGITPALKIAGTSGGVAFESARVRGAQITVDTTAVTGTDMVTFTSASGAHGNSQCAILTGAEAGDVIQVNGTITFSGAVTLNCRRVELFANVTNAVTANTAATVMAGGSAQIQDAINIASTGGIVTVGDGAFTGNLTIGKNLTLRSLNGRAATTIAGVSGSGILGTVVVSSGSSAVTIGGSGQGFTIQGIDNPSAGLESAALYFQGAHSGAVIQDNEIQANGDAGLITEFGQAVTNFLIDSNRFSGKTFTGANPAGSGFSQQFSLPNVPRQLVVMGSGGGVAAGSTTGITFTNNIISGTAGGVNTSAQPQGNNLVTIDAANSTITGNAFAGTTTATAVSLRVRRPGTLITGNTFSSVGLTTTNSHVFLQNLGTTVESVALANTFDKGVFVNGTTSIGISIQVYLTSVVAGTTVRVLPGTYTENLSINKNLTLESTGGREVTAIAGVNGLGALGSVVVTGNTSGVTLGGLGKGFTVIGIDNGSPGLENAALYFQGPHSGAVVRGNDIRAAGDIGLLSEYGHAVTGFVIDQNIFSGKTFTGTTVDGDGFGQQFTLPNVPRQLIVFGSGGGVTTGPASNITFTGNLIIGEAGALNGSGQPQGNTLVTLDVADSLISGNTFSGTTTRFGTALRVRRPGTTIVSNTFVSTGHTSTTTMMFLQNSSTLLQNVVPANSFDRGVYVANGQEVGLSIQGFVNAQSTGASIYVLGGNYPESVNTSAKAVSLLAGSGIGKVAITGDLILDSDDTLLFDFAGDTPGTGYDQWEVGGRVQLTGTVLTTAGSLVPTTGQQFTLINCTGSMPVSGAFAALPQAELLTAFLGSGLPAEVSYFGGTGNEVELTVVGTSVVSGNLVITSPAGDVTNDSLTLTVVGGNLRLTDPNNPIYAGPGATQIDANTIEIPISTVTGTLTFNGSGTDDVFTLDFMGGNPLPLAGLFFNGGAGNDLLRVIGNGVATIYKPNATTDGSGILDFGGRLVSFTGLEPVDFDVPGGNFTIVLPNADNVITLTNGMLMDGLTAATEIDGTTGGVGFEKARVRGSAITVDTTFAAGTDEVTIVSASNAHNNTALTISTGAESGDVIAVNGTTMMGGTCALNAKTIHLNADITSPVEGALATTVSVAAPGQIQDGIGVAASAGAVISVAAGTYVEDVTVTKTLTLTGSGSATTTISGPIGGNGSTVAIAASHAVVEGFTLTREGNNTADWNAALNLAGVSVQGAFTGIVVRNNVITGNRNGIDINNSSGHSILNNVITFNRTGMILRNQTDALVIEQNTITNNWTVGIVFLDASGGTNSPVQSANGSFFNNNISDNWYGQIVDRQTGGSLPAPGGVLKNFSGNWLGSTSPVVTTANSAEPGYAAQVPVEYGGTATAPGGQPDIAGSASANVDFTPLLISATDTNVESATGRGTHGFQGDLATVMVTQAGAQSGAIGRIRDSIDLVATSGTVLVPAGLYTENVQVGKPVTLSGANAGTSGVAVRTAETVVRTNGSQSAVFTVSSSGVVIDGFLIDGDDPSTPGVPLTSGDDTNASYGVKTSGSVGSLTVRNNIITRLQIGVRGDGLSIGSLITANWFDSIGHFDFGYAVTLRGNYYADVTNNKMTRVWTGLHANNFSLAGGPATWSVTGNEIRSYAGGILYWLQYQSATAMTISNNQITAEAAAVAGNVGIMFVSLQDTLNPVITSNTISGANYGFIAFNVPTSNTVTLGQTNSVAGSAVAGVLITNNLNFNPIGTTNFMVGGPGAASALNVTGLQLSALTGVGIKVDASGGTSTQAVVSNLSIVGSSGVAGVQLSGSTSSVTLATAAISGFATGIVNEGGTLTVGAGNSVTGGATGLQATGSTALLAGSTFSNLAFTSQTGAYVALSGAAMAGTTLNATLASFDGIVGATATLAENLAIEDKLIHKVDDSSLGYIKVKAGAVFVTPGSYQAPATTASSIQRGIDIAVAGDHVFVAAGTYVEDVNVSKSVSIIGEGAALTTISGPAGGAGTTLAITANNVVVEGMTITREGNNLAQWNDPALNSGGIAIQGAFTGAVIRRNVISGNRTGIDINNSGTHSVLNNQIINNRTGLILRNQTDGMLIEENEITDNWTVGVVFLDASGGSNVPVQQAFGTRFFNNDISGNWYAQVVDRQTGGSLPATGTNIKDFSGNWLGTTTPVVTTANSAEPGYAAQIPVVFGGTAIPPGGQPDIAGAASANVDFTPLLVVGTDTDVKTSPSRGTLGFQGSLATLLVTTSGAEAGVMSRIQEAVNLVDEDGSVLVPSGTYTGSVDTTGVGVTLVAGASPGQVIVNGDLTLDDDDTLPVEINGLAAGIAFDQWQVAGTLTLGDAALVLTGTHTPVKGQSFVLFSNTGMNSVDGAFAGLAEGGESASFLGTDFVVTITYAGDDGNDVVITVKNTSAITVEQPAGNPLITGLGTVDFGFVPLNNPVARVFKIRSTGTGDLTDIVVTKTGDAESEYTISPVPPESLVEDGEVSFTLTLQTNTVGPRPAQLSIASSDPTRSPFLIAIDATGTDTVGGTMEPPLSPLYMSSGFDATGLDLLLTLGFAPPAGSQLVIVNNTAVPPASNPIIGSFNGIPHGGTVKLMFGGVIYLFTADYFGGDGNDFMMNLALPPTSADAAPGAGLATFDTIWGGVVSPTGDYAFRAFLNMGTGSPMVTAASFTGIWKGDIAGGYMALARTGTAAPGVPGATFSQLPGIPWINEVGEASFYGAMQIGAAGVTAVNDTGVWSEMGGALALVLREGDPVPFLSGASFSRFSVSLANSSTSRLAMATNMRGAGVAATNDSAVITADIQSGSVSVGLVAREGDPAPGTSANFAELNGSFSDPRVNAAGDLAFSAVLKNGTTGIWQKTMAGSLAAVAVPGQNAAGTLMAEFSNVDMPSLSNAGTITFHGYLKAGIGDTPTDGSRATGIWKGSAVAPASLSVVVRQGATGLSGMNAGSRVLSQWIPFINGAGEVAFRILMGESGGDFTYGICTDTPGAATVVAKTGDAAPGTKGSTFQFFRQPVIGEGGHTAYIANLVTGGVASGMDLGVWKHSPATGSSLVLRVGDQMATLSGPKTVADINIPSTTDDNRRFDSRVIDGLGRVLVVVTFTDGSSSLVFMP